MTEKIRIKDIAERAGVSVGTVDRVLHQRPNVSPKSLEKVEQALKEMDLRPAPCLRRSSAPRSCSLPSGRRSWGSRSRGPEWAG